MLSCQSFGGYELVLMSDKKVPVEIDLSSVMAFEMPLFQALRRLQQAGEVHAKRLARFGGLTPMQLMILQVLASETRLTASGIINTRIITSPSTSCQPVGKGGGWLSMAASRSDNRSRRSPGQFADRDKEAFHVPARALPCLGRPESTLAPSHR